VVGSADSLTEDVATVGDLSRKFGLNLGIMKFGFDDSL
jgi:hypothetical protein